MAGVLLLVVLWPAGCDHGLEPPDAPPLGAIRGTITYTAPSAWPPSDSLVDLRFFALPFVPRDTLDLFRDINLLVFSETLDFYATRDSFFVSDVAPRTYVYSGVAQQFSGDLLDWRPVGLYAENGGIFLVRPGEISELDITVDFNDLPPFPPAAAPRLHP